MASGDRADVQTVGVDGCRAGWVAASFDGIRLFPDIDSLLAGFAPAARFLIDIPMGLPEVGPRDLEVQARRQLPPKKTSSVFAIPCRAAIYAADYQQACQTNQQVQGKKFSIQTWNICQKIRELDTYLIEHPAACHRVYESHPELAFSRLAGDHVLPSKKTVEGFNKRQTLLSEFMPNLTSLVQDVLDATKRAQVARDDVLDALVLWVTGTVANEQLTDSLVADERGIPIRMLIPVSSRLSG